MNRLTSSLTIACASVVSTMVANGAEPRPNLAKEKVLYEIGYSHLDTQWRWNYPQVIREFLPNTVHENAPLFEKYPDYIFNWSGANRYRMIKEYHPDDFEKVRQWVAEGRWFPCGNSWEESDVNVPSSESLIRQILFGHNFFKREFGSESAEYMLPDCFGFPASLPSILSHCGLRGFSTQKLTWGSAVGIPFNVGVWQGPDGSSVIAALNAGDYNGDVKEDLSASAYWNHRLEENGKKSGLFTDYQYYGVGDRGGSPRPDSVKWVQESVNSTGTVRVISARADQMFRDITDSQKAGLPKYKGDLLLTQHSAGSLTSQAYMKRWNRLNELLAKAAEQASVVAHLLGAAPYPQEKLNHAWGLVLGAQFHDILPGTSLPKAYEYSWNDEVIAMNCFAEVLQNAVSGVARGLDTRVDGVPLVIYNPLGIDRTDVVEAEMELDSALPGIQVVNGNGDPVPAQLLSINGGKVRFLFQAEVPSIGFAVYGVQTKSASVVKSELKITERSLENERYRVTLNDAGDMASLVDKRLGKELLAAPARLAFLHENPHEWPAWNMDWQDRTNPPIGYVDGPAEIRIVENGPVRIALEVKRSARDSTFVQTIRLASGTAGDRVEIANQVDWKSKAVSLKAEFPLTVSNPLATYNLELGKIQRGNNDPKKYEVPTHQWLDLTDRSGKSGVSILTGAKYGSDKPMDNVVRLTLLFTPGVEGEGYKEQATQDWGRHEFVYGLSAHAGDWHSGKPDWQAARMDQPLIAFRTTKHRGRLGREFSLLKLDSEHVAVRAVKLAENGAGVVARLQELNGVAKKADLSSAAQIVSAQEISGVEKVLGKLESRKTSVALDFKPFQLRSVQLDLKPIENLGVPQSVSVALPFNQDVFSYNTNRKDGACDNDARTIPAEMIGDEVVADGIRFAIGSRADGEMNAVRCEGQTVRLPAGDFNRMYLLAMAVQGDAMGEFVVDGQGHALSIPDWSGFLGRWDNRVFEGHVSELTYSVNNKLTRIEPAYIKRAPLAWFCSHRHNPFGDSGSDEEYTYSYLFKFGVEIPSGAKTLKLPDNPRIRVLAISLAAEEGESAIPVQPLYDDFSKEHRKAWVFNEEK